MFLVMSSELSVPESSPAARSKLAGALTVVSIVMLSGAELPEVLPAVSVAVAVSE